jgi:hypothetical protein
LKEDIFGGGVADEVLDLYDDREDIWVFVETAINLRFYKVY